MSYATIKRCTCDNEGQDKLHGRGLRAHNETANGNWRCTVCGNEKSGSAADKRDRR
jgi:hypothetical protein